MIRSWADLIDQSYPELVISVRCAGANFRDYLANFDFSPFVEVTTGAASGRDFNFDEHRYFVVPERFEEYRRGMPCATYLCVKVSDLELELSGRDVSSFADAHARTMDILRFLVKDDDMPWRWTGYSRDPETSTTSEHRQGVLVVAIPPG